MWAVWFISMDQRLYIALLDHAVDDRVSASLFGRFLRYFGNLKHNKQMTVPAMPVGTMCRGSNVKDTVARSFQLESLILAQNERWRHA